VGNLKMAPHPEEFVLGEGEGILCTVTAHEQGVTEISTLLRQSKGVLIFSNAPGCCPA
jgi:hypothetical protein